MTSAVFNPFDQGGYPSLSFDKAPAGTFFTGTILEPPLWLQSHNFEDGKPAYWDEEKTAPIMAAVVNIEINGEEFSIWAEKPSGKYVAIRDAVRAAGKKVGDRKLAMEEGGTLTLTYTSDGPKEKGSKLSAPKLYTAVYVPPVVDEGPGF